MNIDHTFIAVAQSQYSSQHVLRLHWFFQKVDGTQSHGCNHICHAGKAREKYDGNQRSMNTSFGCELEATAFRHAQICNDRVDPLVLQALQRGMEVTVDAEGLSVHAGLHPGIEDQRFRRNLMEESPIHEILGRALTHISPLNLTDPSSPAFHPSKVKTLHDITRFCHEKAVVEMFSFGRDHEFPRFSAKQLHHNVPMQWWVLNLDDGFTEEIRSKYVHLEQISCTPMLALWDGMVAIPWDGPPAMSGSGFASVLFEATRNPALATPFKKPYAQRNYFMVSANFMNLQSRFGFHFSTVETLAGERDSENYLVFSLKGGAADLERRVGRARFIADLLDTHGFSLRVIEDTVTARASAMPRDEILTRLKIVGYLLMHTRQLDMVMRDPASVEHYRAKLEGDIVSLLDQKTPA